MTTKIVLASTNAGKVAEFARLLDDPRIFIVNMSPLVPPGFVVEETGTTFEENAWLKASQVAAITGLPALADDSGLEVDALGGRPGVFSARYAGPGATDEANNELLLRELAGVPHERRTARFVCCLVGATPGVNGVERIATAHGVVEGHIGLQPRGSGGFGYDPLFLPRDFSGATTASLSGSDKDSISHRGQAARRILTQLSAWLDRQTQR
jgi:XTP/dITP diphosphohydrolase